ncbi:MAG: hypothetical protein CR994_03345 [Maribacter sp.]|nr:MAG: hypothetical protein CR994_03345 [Maribacter sp.]
MKKIHTILFILCSFVFHAQESVDFTIAQKEQALGFKLYPNPAYDDVVYVTTQKNTHKHIIVYDIFGEAVLDERIFNTPLNISRLTPGVYVVRITADNNTINRKLVVK